MEYRKLGRTGMEISAVALGAWVMGGAGWGGADDGESVGAIGQAIDSGITLIDTAEAYGDGHSETVVGKAIAGKRDRLVISTKLGTNHMPKGDIQEACGASLKRLGIDVIDIYFVHWPPEVTPMAAVMEPMRKLQEQGKIRCIGASNFSVAQLEEARKTARIEVVQPAYSLFWRRSEEDGIVDYCVANEISIICYSPIAQGLLTGKFDPDLELAKDDNRQRTVLFQPGIYEKCLAAVDTLRPLARRNGKTLVQTAINWLINQKGVTSAIVGGRRPDQVIQNAGGAGWRLSDEDMAEMRRISEPIVKAVRGWDNMWNYHPRV